MEHTEEETTIKLAELLTRASWRLRKNERKELAPFGLTFAQARALRVLVDGGPMRIGDLADRLEIVPRSATTRVDDLEAAGLVTRRTDPDDRRSVIVVATEAGNGSCRPARGRAKGRCGDAVRPSLDRRKTRSPRTARFHHQGRLMHPTGGQVVRSMRRGEDIRGQKVAPGTARRILRLRRPLQAAAPGLPRPGGAERRHRCAQPSLYREIINEGIIGQRGRPGRRARSGGGRPRHRGRRPLSGRTLRLRPGGRGPRLRPAHQGLLPRAAHARRLLHPRADGSSGQPPE